MSMLAVCSVSVVESRVMEQDVTQSMRFTSRHVPGSTV